MWDCPSFLDLPERPEKPRSRGVTYVLDRGMPIPIVEAMLAQSGHLVDVLKIGWGTAYLDPAVKDRVALCRSAGIVPCLGEHCRAVVAP